MDREIKFRAWDEQNKTMHYNFQFIKSGDEGNDWIIFTSDKQKLDDKIHPLENPYFQRQFKIMEWSGIKNIYEGDVVTSDNNDTPGVVKYDNDRFFVERGQIHSKLNNNHKVIGNIFETDE